MTVDLSVCLVNHNAKELILDCIESIYNKTNKTSFEIILVDNNSTDGSQEPIEKAFPEVKIIENKQNKGFAYANNQAVKFASGKYIMLLNNDTILKNDALDKMVTFIESKPKVGALTCKLYNANKITVQSNCRSFPTPLGTMFGRASLLTKLFPNNPWSAKNLLSDWDYNSPREIDWASGAALMVRRAVINQIGLLDDKNFFIYWEDTDWCKRIHDAGWKIMFIPDAEIIHLTGRGGGQRKLLLRLHTMFQMHRSAYLYFLKHHFKNPVQPQAILVFLGMTFLIFIKGAIEIFSAFRIKSQ